MHTITLDSETDFDGWRKAARTLVLNDVSPADVTWRVQGDAPELFESTTPLPDPPNATFNVPAKFVELAKAAILHRNSERFAILYRLLWRLRGNHDLLVVATDPDVASVAQWRRPCITTSTRCTPSSASVKSAASRNRISSPGSSRSTISSNWQRRSSPGALPTCPGRS